MGPDGFLFLCALLDEGVLLIMAVYYVITLSDLECDYLNATACCEKLNYWVLPVLVCHNVMAVAFLLFGHWIIFLLYCPIGVYMGYRFFFKPSGDIGLFDPAEIHNQKHLRNYMRESLVSLGFHLIFFFVCLYWMIYSLIHGY